MKNDDFPPYPKQVDPLLIKTTQWLDPIRKRFHLLTKDKTDYTTEYNLFADEGGFIGTPRYIISKKKIKRAYFCPQCKANISHIKDFVERSIIAWAATHTGDFSNTFEIEVI